MADISDQATAALDIDALAQAWQPTPSSARAPGTPATETTETYPLDVTEEGVGSGNSTALIVNVAADAAPAAIEWIQKSQLAVGTIVTATPSAGTGPRAVPTPVAANTLAVAVRDLARRHANAESLHLFLIGPLGLAVLMGHHWNRVTTTHVYEHLGGPDYVHAFTVDA